MLIYRTINLQIELNNLQIAISFVLKYNLISELSPFTKTLSKRDENSNAEDGDDDDDDDESLTHDSHSAADTLTNDSQQNNNNNNNNEKGERDNSILLSYFVKMDISKMYIRNKKNQNEMEERSKHGYEIVQYMAYKLHGYEHNIHKSSHYNTIEEFDQIKKIKCIGSNHCNKQLNLEMKTSILTGCYQLFKLQSQINYKNNCDNNNNNNDEDEKDDDIISSNDDEQQQQQIIEPINWTQRDVIKQLDTMIDEATDTNRLCRMYEGWAPWM